MTLQDMNFEANTNRKYVNERIPLLINIAPNLQNHSRVRYERQDATSAHVCLEPRRWFVVIAICNLVFILGGQIWTTPIVDRYIDFLDISQDIYITINSLSIIASILSGLFYIIYFERIGLRVSAYLATTLTAIGSIIRALVFSSSPNNSLSFFWYHKTYFAALAEILCCTLFGFVHGAEIKVARDWFASDQTGSILALTLSSYAFSSGFTSIITPNLVTKTEEIYIIPYILLGVNLLSIITVLFGITKSRPDIPPSRAATISASISSSSLLKGFRQLFRSTKLFWSIFIISYWTCIPVLMQNTLEPILNERNYDNRTCGNLLGLWSILSVLLLIPSGILADNLLKTRDIQFNMRFVSIVTFIYALAYSLFGLSNGLENHEWLLYLTIGLLAITYALGLPILIRLAMRATLGIITESTMGVLYGLIRNLLVVSFLSLVPLLRSLKGTHLKHSYNYVIVTFQIVSFLVFAGSALLFRGYRHDPSLERD